MRKARLYSKLERGKVQCLLCAHQCTIDDGKMGICQVRENRGGELYTHSWGRVVARGVDPIEKKPLHRFHPGSLSYSVATPGCNFRCGWCQNADIARLRTGGGPRVEEELSPQQIVAAAQDARCASIAYTYTEPTLAHEYDLEVAKLAHARGIKNIHVTNGFISAEALLELGPLLGAANVDLKAMRDSTYRRQAGARLRPVLDTLRRMRGLGIWIEVTTLLIPGVNDDLHELTDLARFIAVELGPDVPWHLSRFHPAHRMRATPATSVALLRTAADIGREQGLRHVVLGNLGHDAHVDCHHCQARVIERAGYAVVANRVDPAGRCPECGTPVDGVGMAPGPDPRAVPAAPRI